MGYYEEDWEWAGTSGQFNEEVVSAVSLGERIVERKVKEDGILLSLNKNNSEEEEEVLP